MPTYQYECSGCGYSFEILQSIKEEKLRKCTRCGKFKLHRLIGSGSGIIFKGSGFYETDYKRNNTKKAECSKGTHLKSCACASSSDKSASHKNK